MEWQVQIVSDAKARKMKQCPACGADKDPKVWGALAVCWNCFKYRKDIIPYKYAGMGFTDWLKSLKSRG